MAATGSVADLDRGAVPPIRVLAVDDHPMYRAGLTAVLSLHADLELVAEAGDGARAVELFRTHRPDVTLMDLRMPVMGGAEAIGRTEGTVKVHVLHVFQKLEVNDRTEAVIVALQRGIIHLD